MKIAVLSNINLNPLRRVSPFTLSYFSGFNQYHLEFLKEDSEIYRNTYDVILCHFEGEELLKEYLLEISSIKDIELELIDKLNELLIPIENYLKKQSKSLVILNNISLDPYQITTHIDQNSDFSLKEIIEKTNQHLKKFSMNFSNVLLMDWVKNINYHGYKNIYSKKFWYLGRIKYSQLAFKELANEFKLLVKAYQGKSKKVLVLDLDNTLWGGIAGEDGVSGIYLSEDGVGKAYRDLQLLLKSMKDLGVLLAICSKNNFDDIKEIFEKNKMMILQLDDFVSKKINWVDKASNIREIANELNLGLDSCVFIDDNRVEREFVKAEIGEVVVPEFPTEPEDIPQWFVKDVIHNYFPKLYFTAEDRKKSLQYKTNVIRRALEKTVDLSSFLRSLCINTNLLINDERYIKRIAQLTQKTNQFNLTTRRYSEKDIETFMSDQNKKVFSLDYKDKFGEEGIIAVAIVFLDAEVATIDTYLMSCRVIGRNIEYIFLYKILSELKKNNISEIYGEFFLTKKNGLASEFYGKSGFTVPVENDGTRSEMFKGEMAPLLRQLEECIS